MAGFDQHALIVDEWNRLSLYINEVVELILDEWDNSTIKSTRSSTKWQWDKINKKGNGSPLP
jgi:hypothetical protein